MKIAGKIFWGLAFFLLLIQSCSAENIGTYNSGNWYLDLNGDGIYSPSVDIACMWGAPGYQPVIGDWNFDGKEKIGTYNPDLSIWYLDYNGNGIWEPGTDKTYNWGAPGYQPVIGDWNFDGKEKIGTYNPDLSIWYLDYNGNGIWEPGTDKTYNWGAPGYIPVVGKWITASPALVAPVAAFTSNVRNGTVPLTVQFTNQSTGTPPLTSAWDFNNDGVADSSDPSPSYIYTMPGIYTVNLTVSNGAGSDSEKKAGYINVTTVSVKPVAAFSADERYGYAPLSVRFTSQSTGTIPLMYAWDFTNDGENDSNINNPMFTYSTPGTYTVKLTVTNSAGSDSEIKNGYITVYEVPVAPVAGFFANKRSGNVPLTVMFTDSSTGTALEYAWDFTNDGKNDSFNRNPTYTYSATGTYTVKLTVTNEMGTDVARKTAYINVSEGQPGESHAGVALTFDDNSIDQWYAIRSLLQQYNAHVTFFVNGFGNLDEEQIDKLRTLQADGHEIAFHGMNHEDAAIYLETHSIQQYLDYEIIPGVNLMKNAGLTPVDFAYPYGSENGPLTTALQAYFSHVRGTHSSINDPIFYEYGSNQLLIQGVGIDDQTYGVTMNEIYEGISTAKQEDKILIFYAHVPLQTVTGDYMISYGRLENILKNVSENNMKFYTVSELQ